MIKFIHSADNHLGSRFASLGSQNIEIAAKTRSAQQKAFQNLIDKAIAEDIDFLLLAGDLYDSEAQNIKTLIFVRNEFERLKKAGIKVFYCQGNHDFEGKAKEQINFPDNVTWFEQEIETIKIQTKSGEKVAITAFSYKNRWVQDRMAALYPPKAADVDYHLGMLHGSLDQSQSTEQAYAPFSLEDLKQKHYDYWALGHIHKRMVLNETPPIIYPGNTQGLNRLETGEKGAYLVELNQQVATCTFFPTAPIEWQSQELSLGDCPNITGVERKIQDFITKQQQQEKSLLISLELKDYTHLNENLLAELEDLKDTWQAISIAGHFVYIYKIILQLLPEKTFLSQQMVDKDTWETIKSDYQDEEKLKTCFKDLFEHRIVSQQLRDLKEDNTFLAEIWHEAELNIQKRFYLPEDEGQEL